VILADLVLDVTPLKTSRDFRAVFGSRTVALMGAQATDVALLVQAKQLTNSPLPVGLLGLAQLVPLLVFGLYGGALADRLDRKALMRWCEPALAACAGLLLVNALQPRPLLWPLYAVAALMTAVAAVQRPSFDAAVPRLVPLEQRTAAMALLSMSQTVTVLAGSAIGGVLAITPGAYSVYALEAAGFIVSFWFLSRLPSLPQPRRNRCAGRETVVRDIVVSLRYAVSRKDLMGSYLVDLAAMIFAYPNALLPFMAVILHAPWAAGLMFAAPSAGAFVVSATSGWMNRVRRHGVAIAVAAATWGVALGALGLAPDIWTGLLLLAVAGGADEASAVFRSVLWNQTIPDELRGRMAGVELLSFGAGPAAGQLRGGVVARFAGSRLSLVSGGLACVVGVAAACVALPPFWRYRAADPADPGSVADGPAGADVPAVPELALPGDRGLRPRPIPSTPMSDTPAAPTREPAASGATPMGLPEWTVLAVMSQQPTHGFAVALLTTPDGELGRVWQIPRPVIYRAIGRLAEASLIAPRGTEPGQGPQRTIYAATDEGRRAVGAWLDTPVEHVRDIRSHFLLKLALLHRQGADPASLIRRQREVLAPIATAVDAETPRDEGFDTTLLAWRRANAAAAIAFLDDIAARAPTAR
jgi:MFS family permease